MCLSLILLRYIRPHMGVVIRQSFKALVSNYVGMAIGFVGLFFIFPRVFEPEQYGLFRLLIELAAILSPLALLGTHYSINKYFVYFKNEQNGHNGFFYYVSLLPTMGLVMVIAATLLFQDSLLALFAPKGQVSQPIIIPILLLLVVFSTYITVIEAVSSNFGRIAKPYFVREVLQRIGLIVLALLYYFQIIGFYPMLWCMVIVYALNFVLNICFTSQLSSFSFKRNTHFNSQNKPLFTDMARYSGFLFIGGLSGLVINKLDIVMVSGMKNLTYTAIYSVGFYLAMFIELPKRGFLQILTPIISNHIKDSNSEQLSSIYKRSSINLTVAGAILFAAIWVNLPLFYHLMPRGEIYAQGKWVVLIMGIGKLIELSTGAASPIVGTSKYYGYAFINFFSSGLIAVLGNLLLIPLWGINGAAIATLAVIVFSSCLAFVVVRLKFGMQPFTRSHFVVLLATAALIVLSHFSFNHTHVWTATIFKNLFFLLPFLASLYLLRVSPDINEQISQFYKRFIRKQ